MSLIVAFRNPFVKAFGILRNIFQTVEFILENINNFWSNQANKSTFSQKSKRENCITLKASRTNLNIVTSSSRVKSADLKSYSVKNTAISCDSATLKSSIIWVICSSLSTLPCSHLPSPLQWPAHSHRPPLVAGPLMTSDLRLGTCISCLPCSLAGTLNMSCLSRRGIKILEKHDAQCLLPSRHPASVLTACSHAAYCQIYRHNFCGKIFFPNSPSRETLETCWTHWRLRYLCMLSRKMSYQRLLRNAYTRAQKSHSSFYYDIGRLILNDVSNLHSA
jgi:hypothetical protein